jgi:hypothetical protein
MCSENSDMILFEAKELPGEACCCFSIRHNRNPNTCGLSYRYTIMLKQPIWCELVTWR